MAICDKNKFPLRELMAICDAVLPGENSQKLVFANISDVHDYVAEHYTGCIQEQRRAGKRSIELWPVQAARAGHG